jgi:hypothetical protein
MSASGSKFTQLYRRMGTTMQPTVNLQYACGFGQCCCLSTCMYVYLSMPYVVSFRLRSNRLRCTTRTFGSLANESDFVCDLWSLHLEQ